jgi:hypothetical protein
MTTPDPRRPAFPAGARLLAEAAARVASGAAGYEPQTTPAAVLRADACER